MRLRQAVQAQEGYLQAQSELDSYFEQSHVFPELMGLLLRHRMSTYNVVCQSTTSHDLQWCMYVIWNLQKWHLPGIYLVYPLHMTMSAI